MHMNYEGTASESRDAGVAPNEVKMPTRMFEDKKAEKILCRYPECSKKGSPRMTC